ncbi:hypothetical protein ABBQ38_014835 [Trebouxia sp. C0009 RCD-2024]
MGLPGLVNSTVKSADFIVDCTVKKLLLQWKRMIEKAESQEGISISGSNIRAAVLNPSKLFKGTGNLEDGELVDDSALDTDRHG